MSQADIQYNQLIFDILQQGVSDEGQTVRTVWDDGTPAHSKSILSRQFRFDNSEIPILTTKKVAWKTAIKELLWIWQQQSTNVQNLRDVGVRIWDEWEGIDGTIGRSYGGQFESHRYRKDRSIVLVERKIKEKHEKLKDTDYERTICGVGYIGNIDNVKNFSKEEIKMLKDRWIQMIYRCYNESNKRYADYGGKGVFVDERWHSFENYLRDIREIPQYIIAKQDGFKGWVIDKDYFESNCYSKETCVWLSSSDNTRYTSKHKPFYVIDKNGNKQMFIDLMEACLEYGFDKSNLSKALKNKKTLKGCHFEYIDDDSIYRYELSRNQVIELIHNIKNNPSSRRLMTSFWNYADVNKKELQECVWTTQWYVKNNKLSLEVRSRSNDMALGNPFNVFQYNVLQRMIAQVTGYELGEYIFNIGDAHIYSRHEEGLREQIFREQYEAPKLWINPEITNFYDFTIDDFKLIDYKHGSAISFEVAI